MGGAAGSLSGSGGAAGAAGVVQGGADAAGSAGSAGVAGAAGGGFVLPSGVPATVLLDGAELAAVQQALAGGSGGTAEQQAALQNLIAAADLALVAGTWTVTSKDDAYVVNEDPNLYVSWGPYWWPPDANPPEDPGTMSSCPYVSHDGVRNPAVTNITDRHGLHASSEAILQLALAWYFTGNPAYADQAALVARTWYLDPATRMKPDMSYAQQHGPCGAGSPAGLIEASGGYLTDALDGLAILALDTRPQGWTAADQDGIQQWMTDFLDFLDSSSIGQGEDDAANNHGTWYDALVSSMLLFVGDSAGAAAVCEAAKQRRIDAQIEADGSMPEELSRTTSWHYANYNVSGLCRLAGVAAHVGVDLWGYQSAGGGSINEAIAFLIPTAVAADGPGPWDQYGDITTPFDAVYKAEAYYSIRAAAEYGGDAAAAAVFAQDPLAIDVPARHCAGDRFPTGSTFCGVAAGDADFIDLQAPAAPAVDMWPLIPTCRVPIH